MKKTKVFIIIFIILAIAAFYVSGSYEYLKLERIQKNLDDLRAYYDSRPAVSIAIFMALYVSITAMSIPGAIVLTLLAGAIFGVVLGTILVSLACTIGATAAFFLSRYLFRESLLKKYKDRLKIVNKKLGENSTSYLFTLRLIPVSPFVVINVMMGLTSVNVWKYIWITFVGMFPGNFIYVYAGRKIAEIKSASEILTWPIILTLTLLGVLPWIIKKLFNNKPNFGENYEPNHR